MDAKAGLSGAGFAINGSASWLGVQGFTPTLRRPGLRRWLAQSFRPHFAHESRVRLVTPNRSGLRPSFPARPICCSAFRHRSASLASPTARTTMPSADFCLTMGSPRGSPSPVSGHDTESPEVSSIAFPRTCRIYILGP